MGEKEEEEEKKDKQEDKREKVFLCSDTLGESWTTKATLDL